MPASEVGRGYRQVRRTCAACGHSSFICDSGEYWDEAEPRKRRCPECRGTRYEVGVGFSLREEGEVRWVWVGERCMGCGVLGCFVDWKVDYSPSRHLLRAV